MNLLGAANYDPVGGAVTKATTSLIAMTAFDTTNLRVAFTVPSHGMVHVRMSCVHHGATTIAQLFLGCLEGATLRGRAAPSPMILGTSIAAALVKLEVAFTITGLTPGAVNWDAAYGVETVANAGGIKYGGPNDTSGNNAFGGFNFEIWDPKPNPANFGLLSIDANGRVDIIKVAGTTQTAGDIIGDTNDIQSRLPAALISGRMDSNISRIEGAVLDTHSSGMMPSDVKGWNSAAVATPTIAGVPEVDLTHINGLATSGNNATLNLKQLNITNSAGDALVARSTGGSGHGIAATGHSPDGIGIKASGGTGVYALGSAAGGHGVQVYAPLGSSGVDIIADVGVGLQITSDDNAILAESFANDAVFLLADTVGKKSIQAAQDIALPSGDLDDQLQALPTAAENADAAWDEAIAGHLTAGSTGEKLNAAGAAGDPWGTALPGAYGAGTAGKIIGDNINATVSSRATQTSVDDIPTNAELATALGTADDATLAAIAALNNLSAAQVNTEVDTALSDVGLTTTITGRIDAAVSTRSSHSAADVWAAATRTLTAISDSAGVTTLLSRIASALNITSGKVESNVKQINDTNITGDGSGTPWGPA
jgi:hypothetical protein